MLSEIGGFSFQHLILQYGFWGIIAGSLMIEDATLAASFLLLGTLSFQTIFWGNLVGICAGDLWLYILGFNSHRLSKYYFFRFLNKIDQNLKLETHPETFALMNVTVFTARFLPGTRILTYGTAGFLRYPLFRFFILTTLSTVIWVYAIMSLGLQIQDWVHEHWLPSLVLFVGFLFAIRGLVTTFQKKNQ